MAKIQVKPTNSARLRAEPSTTNDKNVIGMSPASTIIEHVTLSDDGQWYEIQNMYIHASTVNVLEADPTVDPTPTPTRPLNPIPNIKLDPLKVPYRSQWDVDANNRTADCGQTCVAMLAQHHGIKVKINDLRFQSQPSGLSSSMDLVNNLGSVNIKASYRLIDPVLNDEGIMVPPQLEAELPAICLVSYAGFDRTSIQDKKYTGWHWLILLAVDPVLKNVIVNDPDFWAPRREEGNRKHFTYNEWNKAFIPYSGGKLQYVYTLE